MQETAARLSLNHLLVLLPQLRLLEGDLDAAASDDDHKLAIRSLVAYSHTATQVASLVEREDGASSYEQLITDLREAAQVSSAAKSKLVTGGTTKPVKAVAKYALERIGGVSSAVAGLAAEIQVREK